MLRLIGGEFIIACLDETSIVKPDGTPEEGSGDTYKLKDARVFNLQMTMKGAAIAFVPIFPFSPNKNLDKIEIDKKVVLLKVDEKDIDGEILNGYKSNISGIDLSASSKFVM